MAHQLPNAGETAVPEDILRQFAKEAFHQVEPGRTGRREVQVESGTPPQPLPYLLVLVRAVVVDDQVQFQLFGCFPVDLLEEP